MSTQATAWGVLLINLGTPDGAPGAGPSDEQVKRYLREFLMDPYVIDLAFPLRWLFVSWLLHNRPAASAAAYRKIWTERGSPLRFHHLDLCDGIRRELGRTLGNGARVEAAMRYGSPSIPSALERLREQGVGRVLVVPLYPQYSLAATRTSWERCLAWARKRAPETRLELFPPFFDSPEFVEAFARVAEESLAGFAYDHLLFSFHGLPVRHLGKKAGRVGPDCGRSADCCDGLTPDNPDCYRAQCFATAHALARALGVAQERYTVCFQSRLGRTPWIKPYTDHVYRELAARGAARVAVLCPAFVADCLETLEEIGIRGRAEFIAAGGRELRLVPSLNASPLWVSGLARMIEAAIAGREAAS